MGKKRVYLSYLLRLGWEILPLEAGFLALCWLLNHYWSVLQRFGYADVLFIVGTLAGMIGSAGLMRSPYSLSLSPWGVWASPVQASEDEKRTQLVDELMHQTSFGMRILAIGVIAILLAVALTTIK